MKSVIIGISCFGHDAAASVVDASTGEVLFALAEERLSNIKHDWRFPIGAINKCKELINENNWSLKDVALNFIPFDFTAGTLFRDIDELVNDPVVAEKLKSLLTEIFEYADYYDFNGSYTERTINAFLSSSISVKDRIIELKAKIFWYYNWSIKYRNISKAAAAIFPDHRVKNVSHHLAHAASAYFNSGFSEAACITLDGQGESETLCVYDCRNNEISKIFSASWPFSFGIFYLNVTQYLGFHLGDEYKVMGMAAYGKPVYESQLKNMFSYDGRWDLKFKQTEYYSKKPVPGLYGHYYFNFNKSFEKVVPRRSGADPIRQQHFDLAASAQKVMEDLAVDLVKQVINTTGKRNIVLSGGVALNGLMNEQIRQRSGLSRIFIYPAAGDDGTCVGAAQYLLAKASGTVAFKPIYTSFYGQNYEDNEIEAALKGLGVIYKRSDNIHREIAKLIAEDKIVARFNGRSEFGPRALGNRSILANPINPEMKNILNERIKHREQFRPFAPACLKEEVSKYFNFEGDSPFMLLIVRALPGTENIVPAIVHNDGTARVQTIDKDQNPNFYETIKCFKDITGVPILINTSFNVNGETIVETPLDAIESFGHMDIDYLAIGNFLVNKSDNKFDSLSDKEYLEKRKRRYDDAVIHPLKHLDLSMFHYLRGAPGQEASIGNPRGLIGRLRKKLG